MYNILKYKRIITILNHVCQYNYIKAICSNMKEMNNNSDI